MPYTSTISNSPSVKAADTTPPGIVTPFTATAGVGLVQLSWGNPTDPDFVGVMIRRNSTGYPANSSDGYLVTTGNATGYTDLGLPGNVPQFYTAFSFDGMPNYASGFLYAFDGVRVSKWFK